jgi:hypothetical protein
VESPAEEVVFLLLLFDYAASALNHPNIITIHDIASENGIDFIVMEYVQGKTLGALVPRKGLRLNETLNLAIQMADAVLVFQDEDLASPAVLKKTWQPNRGRDISCSRWRVTARWGARSKTGASMLKL